MPVKRKLNLHIFPIFNSQVDKDSMGGGDKIVLKVIEKAVQDRKAVTFLGTTEGGLMMKKHLPEVQFIRINNFRAKTLGVTLAYILRILAGAIVLKEKIPSNACIWSSSDFLPDTVPAFILKLFKTKRIWFGNLFLVARNPFNNEVGLTAKNILNFVSQRITLIMYKLLANHIFVLNHEDKVFLIKNGIESTKISLLSGGIDLKEIDQIKFSGKKRYDACFIGRFHRQKGIPDLFYVWSRISKALPNAKLAVVGWGDKQERYNISHLIKKYKLSRNVELLGFKDGADKIRILKSSKVLIFPSNFESWGVVIAEALASEIPVIAYRLKEIQHNFKAGVVWISKFNKVDMYRKVLKLINDPNLRKSITRNSLLHAKNLDWTVSYTTFIDTLSKY